MVETKWDELQIDCLVKIFTKLSTEEIAESVQYVCKSWYQTTLDPQCWQKLCFSDRSCSDDFVEFAVRRSQGSVTDIICRPYSRVTEWILNYISRHCLKLQGLFLPYIVVRGNGGLIRDLIHNWKDLEYIGLWKCDYYGDILELISLNCKNFKGLICPYYKIGDEEASLIVKFLPKIKVLKMPRCILPRSSLVMILKYCKELEFVDVRGCIGFDQMDDEIGELASTIKAFDSSESMRYGFDGDVLLSFDINGGDWW